MFESGGTTVTTTYFYDWWDEAKQKDIKSTAVNANAPGWAPGFSHFDYDVNGHLKQVGDSAGMRSISYINDAQGQIMLRSEMAGGTVNTLTGAVNGGTVNRKHNFYYFNGHTVGDVGNDGPLKMSYAEQLAMDKTRSRKDTYKNWQPIASADFDQNYEPINDSVAATASLYTVRGGDNLQSIAAAMWGDNTLWYLIADANGLTGHETLKAGQTLTIPNKVTNIHNNSGTYAVYNAGRAVGDTSPTLPEPPPPPQPKHSGHGCGGLGMILVAVVAVVVTVFTAGAALAVLAPAAAGGATAFGAGIAALTGTLGASAFAGAGMLGLAAAAVGGAVGSIVSQGLGIALGVQDKFSWSAVATSAIGNAVGMSGVGADVGNAVAKYANSPVLGVMASSAVGSAVTQGVSVAVGLQEKFSWTQVAASAVGGAVGYGVGNALGNANFGLGGIGNNIVRRTVTGLANGGAYALASGERPNWGLIAADSFGNALGNEVMASMQRRDKVNALVGPAQKAYQDARQSGASFEDAYNEGLGVQKQLVDFTKARLASVLQRKDDFNSASYSVELTATDAVHTGVVDLVGSEFMGSSRLNEITAFSQLPDQIKLLDGLNSGVRNIDPLVNSEARETAKLYEESIHALNGKSVLENINFYLDVIDTHTDNNAVLGVAMHGLVDSVFHSTYTGDDFDSLLVSKTYEAPIGHGLHGSTPDYVTDFKLNAATLLTAKAFADVSGVDQASYEELLDDAARKVRKVAAQAGQLSGITRDESFKKEYRAIYAR